MNLDIQRLGPARVHSPLKLSTVVGDRVCNFVRDDERVLFDVSVNGCLEWAERRGEGPPLSMERAGPREHIYFDSSKLRVGVVTCGGLSPGINNVVRALVMELHYHYHLRHIHGFRFGYRGMVPESGHDVVDRKSATSITTAALFSGVPGGHRTSRPWWTRWTG